MKKILNARPLVKLSLTKIKKIIGSKIIYRSHCPGSSIDWAKQEFDNVSDGTVFLADTYGCARGRHGREWSLYPGQMILTFILKPDFMLDHNDSLDRASLYLNMSISAAIADVLSLYNVGLKWPNDFVFLTKDSRVLKVGGMLIEAVWHAAKLKGFIVGIAINATNEFFSR